MTQNGQDNIDEQINDKLDTSFMDKWFTLMEGLHQKQLVSDTKVFDVNLKQFWTSAFEKFADVDADSWVTLVQPYVTSGYLTVEQAARIYELKDTLQPLGMFLYIALAMKLFFSVLDVTTDASQSFMAQNQNKRLRPALPPYADLIHAAFIAPEKTGEVREVLKKTGFRDEDIDLMFLARYRLYDESYVRELYLRKIITPDQMINRMQELGYTETRIMEMVKSWEIIPGPQDLFHLVAKEAFEPDAIEAMGLDDEFPEEQVEWLSKQGLSDYWAHKYWAAHWEQPSIQMGYEMLHRGVIGYEELDLLYRTVEIPPYWRDKLTQIAFQPLTRVDVRRMHKIGVLDDMGVYKSYKDLGYNDDNALLMTRFTVNYNREEDKELTKGEVIKSYKKGAIDRASATDLLQNVGYNQDTALYYIELADYENELDLQDQQIKNIEERYTNNLISRPDAKRFLDALDLPDKQVSIYLERWELTLYKNTKLPSKSDLTKFIQHGVINADEFRAEMARLGYNYQYTTWYLNDALGKAK